MTQANYVVETRQNSNLQVAGIIDDYATLDMILRYNALSEWTLTIDRKSSHIASLIPVSNPIGVNGNGIIVTRDFGTGPQVILSGPVTHVDYSMSSQLVTVKGYDDNAWLFWRNADTIPDQNPYTADVLLDAVLRFYKFAESSGTTAFDSSAAPVNGTFTGGGFTYSQPALIDGTATSITLNGTTSWLSMPTTSLPAGTASFFAYGWGLLAANPGATAYMWAWGTNAAKQEILLGVTTTGFPQVSGNGLTSITGATAVPKNVPFMLGVTWDGTTLTGYLNGIAFGSSTPGALSITYGTAQMGVNVGAAAGFWPGRLGFGVIGSTTLTAARMLQLYLVGQSRLSFGASDNRNGLASTVMIAYANANAGPGSITKRQVPLLSMAADPSIGGQVTGVAREDNLLTFLQQLALQSGDNIGFKIQQTYNVGSNTLVFSCYAPTDRTGTVLFSDQLGNLLDYSYSIDWPTMNVAIVGDGQNSGAARYWLEVIDNASVTTYGRIEGFVQGASSTDYQTMLNTGNAALLQTKAATNLSITPQDTVGLAYQANYSLGDKVTINLEGQQIQDKIREVHISLTKGSGQNSPDEVITPAIGQPDVAQAVIGLLSALINPITKRTRNTQAQLDKVQRNR